MKAKLESVVAAGSMERKWKNLQCCHLSNISKLFYEEQEDLMMKVQEQQERTGILSTIYYSANDIAQMLGISKSGAYSIIRKLNSELESRGFIVIQGKVSKAYFEEKWYGLKA